MDSQRMEQKKPLTHEEMLSHITSCAKDLSTSLTNYLKVIDEHSRHDKLNIVLTGIAEFYASAPYFIKQIPGYNDINLEHVMALLGHKASASVINLVKDLVVSDIQQQQLQQQAQQQAQNSKND